MLIIESEAHDMVQVQLMFTLPKERQLSILSASFPELSIAILSLIPLTLPKGLALLQINGPNLEKFLAFIDEKFPNNAHSVLSKELPQIMLSLELSDPWILEQILKIEINVRFPILVKAGKMKIEIIARRNKIDVLLNQFENANFQVHLNRIGRIRLQSLLTIQQKKILKNAKEWGFFEIPRRISLHDFAEKMGISSSALSENLRRITSKLVKDYFENNS